MAGVRRTQPRQFSHLDSDAADNLIGDGIDGSPIVQGEFLCGDHDGSGVDVYAAGAYFAYVGRHAG